LFAELDLNAFLIEANEGFLEKGFEVELFEMWAKGFIMRVEWAESSEVIESARVWYCWWTFSIGESKADFPKGTGVDEYSSSSKSGIVIWIGEVIESWRRKWQRRWATLTVAVATFHNVVA
jgi:hypothetical protein